MTKLAVSSAIPALRQALLDPQRAVLSAPPGSGKTTLVPLELLQEPWLTSQRIILLEPRRLAARAAAARMADLLGEPLGETVGYRIRMDRRVSDKTRIEVVTEGILTRRLQQDPELQGVGLVIFDEFHERSLHADLALALTLDVMSVLRDDLRLLVMSATLQTEAVSRQLAGAPVIHAAGRSYPVQIHYLGDPAPESRLPDVVSRAILQVLAREQGDLLVFLPGAGEIRQVAERLAARSEVLPEDLQICPLYGDLTKAKQDRAILPDPQGRQRVVLATSIAETSLTIEGVTAVLDSGWSRLPRFLPSIGMSRLETLRVSQAAAEQRAGRAGRLGPGACYRLWSEHRQAKLVARQPAEILEADLAPLVLELLQWGVKSPSDLHWLDPPPSGAYAQAGDLLRALGAIDEQGRLTPMGRAMASLPVHPRLAHLLLRADAAARQLACDLAALLEERDILPRTREGPGQVDLELRLSMLESWRTGNRQNVLQGCRQVDRVSRQFQRLLKPIEPHMPRGIASIQGLLALGFPDRIGRRTRQGRFQLSNGRAAWVDEADQLAAAPYIVAARLDAGRTDGRIQLAVQIDEVELRQLPDIPLRISETIGWDRDKQAVTAQQVEHLGALQFSARPLPEVDPEALRAGMLVGIRQLGIDALPWNQSSRQWQSRLICLCAWQPDADWPPMTDRWLLEHLEVWLAPWLDGISRRSQLQKLDLLNILQSRLSWDQRKRMDELVPTHLRVPSGSRKRLEYQPGSSPVLAVRLQEVFGLRETPRICLGQVPLLLHLLSPAQRPIQVTQDLQGFWERTYSEVKRELKGRYPKHYWPDDPYQAQATARVRPRNRD
ncbi:MAG: ATP-dependent helicase HrpB [Gammaproteobacteria bacterium]|nr:ATP-dependent helicase HrpB [Gammaproteobacteria bacterium]